ncbi:phosphoribosylanthranilate isomerase [Pseudazoarcus pumilus]|uniref:N-(5'-phosphoribosyl)anthranilate isomerase n=1 Tax=Pseudazoarcus pumilus TaxID=2067960 RepID=A0A2I6S641_9RHOO|nr:phosphoribosylanthranilate isomerase [Pseudazoarcus pumilus]AUN94737.1 phosphoribosylanthranilate isomerase [Pseudazoarcus pumilus]
MHRTRVKICGLTRIEDVHAAVDAGADAIGLVFYPPSARCVTLERAAELVAAVPPFVSVVGLFVNPAEALVREVLAHVRLHVLQFHGDEHEADCARFARPWLKAARVRAGLDLLEFNASHAGATGILLDAFVEGYGGGGRTFDWSLIPSGLNRRRLILSGGLDADNVTEAVRRVRPWAVDVSSGVEVEKGIKSAEKISAFIAGVRNADG